jgi:hypothetical protein
VEMSLAGQCPAVIWSVAEKGPAPAHRGRVGFTRDKGERFVFSRVELSC